MGLSSNSNFLHLAQLRTEQRLASLRGMSLRARLAILLIALMGMAILFSGLLVWQQHQIATRGADAAIAAHERMARTSDLRSSLAEIDRTARMGALRTSEVARFRQLLARAKDGEASPEAQKSIAVLEDRFGLYLQALDTSGPSREGLIRERFDEVAASVGALVEMYQNAVFRTAEGLRLERKRSLEAAIAFLIGFIFLIVGAGVKAVAMITEPITVLVRRLDEVNPEAELSAPLPGSPSDCPEVALVAGSFERLVQRLRGYRELNIHRLLIEKRRADILAAAITDGIILLRNDEIVYANPTGEQILGIAPGSLSHGQKLSELIAVAADSEGNHGAHRDGPSLPSMIGGAEVNMTLVQRSGPKAVSEAVLRTIPVEFALSVEDRKAHYLVHASRISFDLIESVENSYRQASELGESSGQVSRMLERFQANTLVVAQDVTLVKESQQAKSHFLATLSHEIKTPVTSLTMATRLLRKSLDQIPNPTHRSLIQTCADDVDRLRGLLDDLLTISRFDTLTQRLELQHIDLAKLVRHSVQTFQTQAAEREVELSSKVVGANLQIVVPMDPAKIAWALSNLLINALRHTPRGGRVRAWIESSDEWVKVGVQDSGPGIDRKRQDRIFDKFNPYYDLRVARTGSTGMGLAIAKEIVVAHGGRIWVSSEPGCGAEFCFTLPIRRRSGAAETAINEEVVTPHLGAKGAMSGTPARS